MMKKHWLTVTGMVLIWAGTAFAADSDELKMTPQGVMISAGTLGKLQLSLPKLYDGARRQLPSAVVPENDGATLKYADGVTARLVLRGRDEVRLTFSPLPDRVKSIQTPLVLPMSLAGGGAWRLGDEAFSACPSQRSPQPILGGKVTDRCAVRDAAGCEMAVSVASPWPDFIQFQDNRYYNWPRFQFLLVSNIAASTKPVEIVYRFRPTRSEGKPEPRVDRFGQSTKKNFPDKVRSEEELQRDAGTEREYYRHFTPPVRDAFGGLPGSGAALKLRRTGFFHSEKLADGRQVLVDPEGNLFFMLAVCAVKPYSYTYLAGRRDQFAWLPERKGSFAAAYDQAGNVSFHLANMIRKFGRVTPESFEEIMIYRLKQWGFNSYGAFSGFNRGMPYTPMLPGIWELKPLVDKFFDPFDPANAARLDELMRKIVKPLADDPRLIGYFLANEQNFSNLGPQLAAKRTNAPAKLQLRDFLRSRYRSIEEFNRAWGGRLARFDDIPGTALTAVSPEAVRDLDAFVRIYLQHYYRLLRDTFKKYDRNHLLIGSRFLPAQVLNPDYVGISAEYVDVFSVNYYNYSIEPGFLTQVHRLAGGKPLILSEWSFGTSEQGLAGGVRDTANQVERGLAYRNYVEQSIRLPFVVGVQWFSLVDQPVTGRASEKYNGESQNIGLLNVTDRPYRDFIAEVVKTNYDLYPLLQGKRPPFKFEHARSHGSAGRGQVIQIARARADFRFDGSRQGWPGRPAERLGPANQVLGAGEEHTGADFWLCWDDDNLYLYLMARDRTPGVNPNRGADIWKSDAVELFFGTEQPERGGSMLVSDRQLLIGANPRTPDQFHWLRSPVQPPVRRLVRIDGDGRGYLLEVAIPLKELGITPRSGTVFRFDLGWDESDGGRKRQRQFMWNGTERNNSDRTAWGLARLVD